MPETIRGTGRVRPTFARELVRARDTLGVDQAIGLALRDHRRRLGATQREYAAQRGWSKSRQSRLEARAEEIKLGAVVQALEGSGFALALHRIGAQTGCRDDSQEDDLGAVQPGDWSAAELVARDRAGRRYPANREVRRTAGAPDWWLLKHGTDAMAREPEWSTTPQDWGT